MKFQAKQTCMRKMSLYDSRLKQRDSHVNLRTMGICNYYK